jgi:hypothetical protein
VRRLRQTLQGAEWLLGRWTGLAALVARGNPWGDPQRRLALDLLGTPGELREGSTPLDLEDGDAPAPAVSLAAHQARLAETQLAELNGLCESLLRRRDADERNSAAMGVSVGFGPLMKEIAALRRYEASCQRRLLKLMGLLLSGKLIGPLAGGLKSEKSLAGVKPEPPPEAKPESRPAPAPSLPAVATPLPTPPIDALISLEEAGAVVCEPVNDRVRGNRKWRRQQAALARKKAS